MKHRYLVPLVLLLLAHVVAALPADAARPAPATAVLQGAPRVVPVSSPDRVGTTCTLGVTAEPWYSVDYLLPPDDVYYTLLDPAACGCTGPGGVLLNLAHAMLHFPVACTVPVTVSVVAADLTDPNCPAPMPGAFLCPEVPYDLAVSNAGVYDFVLALNPGCCITGKAFLALRFVSGGNCGTLPRLIATDGCVPCVSWNSYSSGLDELCGLGFPGNLNMSVEAACCDVVSTVPGTWGRIKTIYR